MQITSLLVAGLAAAGIVAASGEVRALENKARHSELALETRGAKTHKGMLTFYWGKQMADPYCGGPTPNDNSHIIAVSADSPYKCNDKVKLSYKGREMVVKVVDQCATCSASHIDTAKIVFHHLSNGHMELGELHGIESKLVSRGKHH